MQIAYDSKIYKFDRFDSYFIQKVEESIKSDPFYHYPGLTSRVFHIKEIDDRFSDEKYYTIHRKNIRSPEHIQIHTDLIINDLYNKTYEYK